MTQHMMDQHLLSIQTMGEEALDLFAEQVSMPPGITETERTTLYESIDARRADLRRTRDAMVTHGVIDPSEVG